MTAICVSGLGDGEGDWPDLSGTPKRWAAAPRPLFHSSVCFWCLLRNDSRSVEVAHGTRLCGQGWPSQSLPDGRRGGGAAFVRPDVPLAAGGLKLLPGWLTDASRSLALRNLLGEAFFLLLLSSH